MTKVTSIELPSCPDALQSAVRDKLSEVGSEICSVTMTESTPYRDQSIISKQYRVIMNRLNMVSVLHCRDDGPLKGRVFTNELIWGDILEIIRTAPEGSALAEVRSAVPERMEKLFSL